MKYGKVINEYLNELKNNNLMDLEKLILISKVVLQYKNFKKIIKQFDKSKEYSYDECCICLDKLGTDYITFTCSHKYHIECAIKLFRNSDNCALCRKKHPELLFIHNSEKIILDFISNIMTSINNIEALHNNINKLISIRSNSSNFLWFWWNRDTKKIIFYLKKFDEINTIAIIKIIKKFTKKTKIDLQYIIDYCKTRKFFTIK